MSWNRNLRPRAMKQPLHRRAAALLWALAFVLGTVGEGFGLHPCPHHAGPDAASHEAHDPAHGGAADGHCGGDSEAAVHAPSQSPDTPHSGPCTCGSACQAASGAALPVEPQVHPAAELVADRAVPALAALGPFLLRPPHFLPFALAPPRLG